MWSPSVIDSFYIDDLIDSVSCFCFPVYFVTFIFSRLVYMVVDIGPLSSSS